MNFPQISYFFKLENFEHKDIFKNLNYLWDSLTSLSGYVKEWLNKKGSKGIFIGKKTTVDKTANIEGPVIIGTNCKIDNQAYIRGPVIIGDNALIGRTEIKHSIILSGVTAVHFNYIGDSILGNNVNLGAGCKIANLRLDWQPIKIKYKEKKIPTKLIKFGAIIGDGSQLGCNCVLNPGTILGKNCQVYPLVSVKSGFYASKSPIGNNRKR